MPEEYGRLSVINPATGERVGGGNEPGQRVM